MDSIKAFVTHTPLRKDEPTQVLRQYYTEKASGTLTVNIQDPKLHQLVQSIQNIIKEKHDA